MSKFEIILLNASRSKSGIGRYAQSVYEASKDVASLYSLAFSREDYLSGLPGKVQKGKYPPVTSGWYLNVHMQNIVFSKLRRIIKDISIRDGIVHLVDPYILMDIENERKVVTVHDVFPLMGMNWAPRPWEKYASRCLGMHKHARNLLTVSNTSKSLLEAYGFSGDITVIYPCVGDHFLEEVSKETAREAVGLPLDKKIVLSISSKSSRKNLDAVRDTATFLGEDYLLVRVGNDIGIGKNFFDVDDRTLNLIYRSSDVLFFPTKNEGFGSPLIESFATRTPIVTTDIDITREVAGDAAVFTDGSIQENKRAIDEAIENSSELTEKGSRRLTRFSSSTFRENLLSFYAKI